MKKKYLVSTLILILLGSNAAAQFTGPSQKGRVSTVERAKNARIGSYVTVTGNIVSHLRENYYNFRDETGEIRVEIQVSVWQNRNVGPDTRVKLLAEVDRRFGVGPAYLWVKSLEIVK